MKLNIRPNLPPPLQNPSHKQTFRQARMLKRNGHDMTTGVSNPAMPPCGKCSKSTSPDLCEKTIFSAIKGIKNGNKTQNIKCNSSPKNTKLDEHPNDKKSSGCHWTCGTKMFSKSEKVIDDV